MDYYRKPINKVVNDVKLKMQLGALTLKLNENNNKIDDLIGVDKNIKKDISTNTSKISNNKSNISTNSGLISANTSNISTNSSQISTNTSSISNNSNQLSTNTSSISTNLEKIDNFTQYILQSGKDFEEKYTIEKQIFKFNKNKHFYTMFEKEIEYNFTKNSLLFIKNNMYYKYDNLSNDYHRLQHEYNIYDGDNLIHKYLFNKDTYYDESLDPILHTNEDFCICFKENYEKIKINLQLHRHNRHGFGDINLEIDDDNENYIKIDYIDKHNEENKNDILSNTGRIDTNEENISFNLGLISTNKSDIASNTNTVNNISSDLEKINKNLSSTHVNILKKVFIYDIELSYEKLKFNYINKSYSIFSKEIEFNFKSFNYIEIYSEILFDYINDYDIGLFKTEYIFYDDRNIQIEKFEKYQTNSGKNLNNYLITKDYMLFINESNNTKLKLDIYVSLIGDIEDRFSNVTLYIDNNYKNKLYIKYYENKINS